eukprot:Nk52_evm2s382 gene=Nk52_evmTU2s382
MTQLSRNQVHELRTAFQLFDKDGDGTISTREVGTVLNSLGQVHTASELQEMIDEADADGNGVIDFDEFLQMMARKMQTRSEDDEIHSAWQVFDKKGTGFIGAAELKEVLCSLNEELPDDQVEAMIHAADEDGDGYVTFGEFRVLVHLNHNERQHTSMQALNQYKKNSIHNKN